MEGLVRDTVVVFSVWLAVMLLGIVVAKAGRTVTVRRRARAVDDVRPAVLDALDTGALPPDVLGRHRRVAGEIASNLLPKLRGDDRDVLAGILADSGILGRARDDLTARSPATRMRAAEMLGNAGSPGGVSHLLTRLSDRDPDVRASAARALGKIGHPNAVEPLLRCLTHRTVPANTVAMALLRIGTAGGRELAVGLESPTPHVRATTAEIAGSLGLTATRPRLVRLLDDREPRVRAAAARALGRLGGPDAVTALVAGLDALLDAPELDAANQEVAVAYARSLGRIGARDAIPVLERSLMRFRALSFVASEALSEMGARRSIASQARRAAEAVPPEQVAL